MNTPTPKKYTSDFVDFKKIKMPIPGDPTKSTDAWEATVNFPEARRVWLSIATPKVLDVKSGDDFPKTTAQITLKDNATGKSLVIVGSLSIPGGSFLQLFGGSLVNNKTLIVRATDECSLYFESKLDD